jgi:hypothetical protein
MAAKSRLIVMQVPETEFEMLLRRASDLLRKVREAEQAARPFVITKKQSSAA